MRSGHVRSLTAAQQFLNLRVNPICAGTGTLHAGRLVWRYIVSPTPLSRSYAVRIDYHLPVSAAVEVGRVWMPKADLPLLVFDQNRALQGFIRALEIGTPGSWEAAA